MDKGEKKKYSVTPYLETKLSKTVQAKIFRKSNFNNHPKFIVAYTFQQTTLTRRENNLNFGRKLTARSRDNADEAREIVLEGIGKKIRTRSQELFSTCICAENHGQGSSAAPIQDQMCQRFENKIKEDSDFLDCVWFSDEAHFLLSEHVSNKNKMFSGTSPGRAASKALSSHEMQSLGRHLKTFWFEDANYSNY